MVADADGSNVIRLLPGSIVDPWLQSSADSQWLGVAADVDGRRILQIVRIDGTHRSTVPLGDLRLMDFQWRPPGDQELLVRAQRLEGSFGLYTVRTDGSNLHDLGLPNPDLAGFDWNLTGAGWNPAGTKIWYNAIEPDPTAESQLRVHRVNADGSGDIRFPAPPDGINQAWASLSPDGTTILVQRFTPSEIWMALLPADGSGPAREIGRHHLTAGGTNFDVGWSPDGSQVLFFDGPSDFVSIDPVTGVETKIDWPLDRIPDWRRDGL
jgi:hypothetical protein